MRRSVAFTLIELVIVLEILAIVALVTFPSFQEIQEHARNAAAKGALAAIREAVQHYRANEISSGRKLGVGTFPANGCPDNGYVAPTEQMVTVQKVMAHGLLPDNPWARLTTHISPGRENFLIGVSATAGTISLTSDAGWLYNPFGSFGTMCGIWANSNMNGETPCSPCTAGCRTENCF